jgi:hypothetical protein
MSEMGQNLLLRRCNIDIRFTSISGHASRVLAALVLHLAQ